MTCPTCGGPTANPWRRAREAKGWSVREAGEAAGVSPSLVSRVENGREIMLTPGIALARAYGVTVESLMPEPSEEKPHD